MTAACDQLLGLREKLDFADAAGAELDVVAHVAPLDLALHLPVQFAHRFDRAVVEMAAEDERLVSALERVLETRRMTGHQAKLIYITANYDNPSGSTLPLDRREALVRIGRFVAKAREVVS